jgi:hypothetical protein
MSDYDGLGNIYWNRFFNDSNASNATDRIDFLTANDIGYLKGDEKDSDRFVVIHLDPNANNTIDPGELKTLYKQDLQNYAEKNLALNNQGSSAYTQNRALLTSIGVINPGIDPSNQPPSSNVHKTNSKTISNHPDFANGASNLSIRRGVRNQTNYSLISWPDLKKQSRTNIFSYLKTMSTKDQALFLENLNQAEKTELIKKLKTDQLAEIFNNLNKGNILIDFLALMHNKQAIKV